MPEKECPRREINHTAHGRESARRTWRWRGSVQPVLRRTPRCVRTWYHVSFFLETRLLIYTCSRALIQSHHVLAAALEVAAAPPACGAATRMRSSCSFIMA